MDVSKLAQEFAKTGCLVLQDFFSENELSAAADAVLAHYDSAGPGLWKANFIQFETFTDPWVPERADSGPFETLRNNERLKILTRALLGKDYREELSLMMRTQPGTGQAWHQDTQSHDPSNYLLNRIVYPLKSPPGAGGLYCVPGSHKAGRISKGPAQESLPGEIKLQPKPGTLILVHSFCFHRVSINESPGPRFSVNLRCRPSSCPENYDSVGIYRNAGYDFGKLEVVDI